MKKIKDAKKKVTIMLRPSVKKEAIRKAGKVAKRDNLDEVSMSQFIEIAINDYHAE